MLCPDKHSSGAGNHDILHLCVSCSDRVASVLAAQEQVSDCGACRRQLRLFGWTFIGSFGFSFFKWFFSGQPGGGAKCGFDNFPALGLKAYKFK